jgi:hypothetical protein
MAIDAATVQAVATGIFGALSAIFYRKMAQSRKEITNGVEELNGHAEDKKIIKRRLLAHGKRIRHLEETRATNVEMRKLQARVEALESRGA